MANLPKQKEVVDLDLIIRAEKPREVVDLDLLIGGTSVPIQGEDIRVTEPSKPDAELPEPVAVRAPIRSDAERKSTSRLENGFDNSEVRPRFQPGDQVIIAKPSGSYYRKENSAPINITAKMIGERFVAKDIDDNGLAYLEGEDGSIYVPENSLRSFKLYSDYLKDRERRRAEKKPEPEVLREVISDEVPAPITEGTIAGIKEVTAEKSAEDLTEEWKSISNYTFQTEVGPLQIATGDVWAFKTKSGAKAEAANDTNRNFIIETIDRSPDLKQLRIKFVSNNPVERKVEDWSGIFQVGTKSHTSVSSIRESERANDEDLANYENRKDFEGGTEQFEDGQTVSQGSNIPQVEIPATVAVDSGDEIVPGDVPEEVEEADQEIAQAVDEADPAIKATDVAETAGEGGTETAKRQELPTTQAELYREAVADGPADSAFAEGLEEQRDRIQNGGETPEAE
ncbi:MAG: hypothetical protein WC451_04415 [Patescibacteria group bacterium]